MNGKVGVRMLCIALGALTVFWPGSARAAEQKELKYNKSWIYLDYGPLTKPLFEGDKLDLTVEYYLDPSEYVEPTTVVLECVGPRGTPPTTEDTSRHTYYGRLRRRIKAQPGRHKHVFHLTVPDAYPQNYMLFLISFEGWPWHLRNTGWFMRRRGFFELETDKPGNLFTYDEPVEIAVRLKNVKEVGQEKGLTYSVHDTTGSEVAGGTLKFTVQKEGQQVPIRLDLKRRGTFLIEVEVDGWEKLHTTFARIPDLMAITRGEPTRFGMTTHKGPSLGVRTEEVFQIAGRLGLTTCRAFTRWEDIQPAPSVYQLEHWDKFFDLAHKHGVGVVMLPWQPPAWALSEGQEFNYRAFECNLDAWEDMVRTVTTRYKGKFVAWEWLNEISPGGSPNYVDDYLNLCRIGTRTARSIDPNLKMLLAGGLYPRSFRLQMLKAGVGEYIDVLPVHYQNGDGVLEARQDLDSAGHTNVAVWEDESGKPARGVSDIWNEPLEDLTNTSMVDWVLRQWTDELAAGCERIIYFGGGGSARGGADYILLDNTPRPMAATLAVFVSKMFRAKPVGVFLLGKGGLFHLFDQGGKPVLVASTYETGGEKVSLHVGAEGIRITDYQGNESSAPAPGGKATLDLAGLRYFVEDADLDVLKAYVVPAIEAARVGSGTSVNVAIARRVTPRVPMLRGKEGKLIIRLRNLYDRRLAGSFRVELPEGWPAIEPVSFSLEPGRDAVFPVAVNVPEDAEVRDYEVQVGFGFAWQKLPRISKPAVLSVISQEMIGNLLAGGDFETPNASGRGPEGWPVNGTTSLWASSKGLGLGLGKRVVKCAASEQYVGTSQRLDLRGGQTYLYTMWVWNRDMGAGSNMTAYLADGSFIRWYSTQVFSCGSENAYWQMYICRREMPANVKAVSFSPFARGPGWVLLDNARVTFFEGTDYAAECHRAAAAPRIDGKLDDWVTNCPIPLVGRNQLSVLDESYNWTPKNLNAVGYLMWDESNLYVAVQVQDDVHHGTGTGDGVIKGDSVILGFDPTNRGPEAPHEAFAYYVSSIVPGGGSGAHTIYRPERYSGRMISGHLFRDSSIYEMAIAKGPGTCVYEVRIPFSELGGIQPGFGGKFAFSIQLNDNDGKGLVAQMNWGGGISPAWRPADFGVVTFVE